MNVTSLYRLSDAAKLLQVHPRTLKRWNADGKIKLVRLPNGYFRVSPDEIARLLAVPFDEPPSGEDSEL